MKAQLLLLHGALGSEAVFDDLQAVIADQFDSKVMNFPGHGGLPIPESGFTIELFTKSVDDFIVDEFDLLKPVYILGYSMGGYIALLSSMQGNKNISGVITFATKMNWTPKIAIEEVKMLDPEIISKKIPHFASILMKRHYPSNWELVMKETASFLNILGNYNPLRIESLSKINIPVKLMLGDMDKTMSIEDCISAYNAIPNGSLSVLPNTPHQFEKVNLNRLLFEINDFIKG